MEERRGSGRTTGGRLCGGAKEEWCKSLKVHQCYHQFMARRAGDYNLHHACAYVRESVRAFVTQFPLKLLQLHIFGKLIVLMNFYTLQYFLVFVNFVLLLSE